VREVRGENFVVDKGAEKSLGRERGCVFGSSPKWLKRPHPKLVHWWLLVHSSLKVERWLQSSINGLGC